MRRLPILSLVACCAESTNPMDAGMDAGVDAPFVCEPMLVDDVVSADATRSYWIATPSSASGPAPLLFLWHGAGHTAREWLENFAWCEMAEREGIIAVSPEALPEFPVWDFVDGDPQTNVDVQFFDALVLQLMTRYEIDRSRIYSVGFSAGAILTIMLGMFRSETLAAWGAASGALFVDWQVPSEKPPALVMWGGKKDRLATTSFADEAELLISRLRKNDQFVVACDHGGGHRWPRGAEEYVWRFLSDHPRDRAIPYEALPESFPSGCQIR